MTNLTRCVLPLLLCISGCADDPLLDEFDTAQQDGFSFSRDLEPEAIELNGGEKQATFSEDHYLAYEFGLDTPNTVTIVSAFGWKEQLENRFDVAFQASPNEDSYSYRIKNMLFVYDESDSTAGDAAWDKINTLAPTDTLVNLQPGRYLVVSIPTQESYDDEATVFTQIVGLEGWESAPGRVSLRLMLEDGRDASGVRLALGAQSAVTDEQGVAVLSNVPGGSYELKVGRDGLDQMTGELSNFDVIGLDIEQRSAAILSLEEYANWRE